MTKVDQYTAIYGEEHLEDPDLDKCDDAFLDSVAGDLPEVAAADPALEAAVAAALLRSLLGLLGLAHRIAQRAASSTATIDVDVAV